MKQYYVECDTKVELPTEVGPYFVKVKDTKLDERARIFEQHDIYAWIEGPENPQAELWINTFDYWLKPITIPSEGITENVKIHLTLFLGFLLKEGYCDSDVYAEPPTAIDQYINLFRKEG